MILSKGGCHYKVSEHCIYSDNEGFVVKVIEESVFLVILTILCPLKPSKSHEIYMEIFTMKNKMNSQIFMEIRGLWRYR